MTTAVNSIAGYNQFLNDGFGSTSDYFNLNNTTGTSGNLFNTYNSGYTTGSYGTYGAGIYGSTSGQLQYNYDLNNQAQSYYVKQNSGQATLAYQCKAIADVISEGQEDEVLTEFNELVSTLKSQPQYAQCNDQELKAIAQDVFANMTGMSLTDAIKTNCESSFKTGLNLLNPFDRDSVSKEDLLAEVNGTKKKAGSGISKALGGAASVGTVAAGAGIGFAVGGPIGAVVGAGIGWIATNFLS